MASFTAEPQATAGLPNRSSPPNRTPRPTPPAPERSVPSNQCQALPTIDRCQALPEYSASIPMASFTAEPQATAGPPNRSSPPNRTPRPTPPAPEQSVPSNRCQALPTSNRCQALPTINRCQALPGYSASIPMASFTAEPQATAGPPNRIRAARPNPASNPASP